MRRRGDGRYPQPRSSGAFAPAIRARPNRMKVGRRGLTWRRSGDAQAEKNPAIQYGAATNFRM
jgi:hypothetical protein